MEASKRVYGLCMMPEDKSVKLKSFLKAHPSVNVDLYVGESKSRAIQATAFRGHAACTRLLIDAKANVELRDALGGTALFLAAEWGNTECVQVLIDSKADVQTANDNNSSAATTAAYNGRHRCLGLLIDAKADVNAKTTDGRTPAMAACHGDQLVCLQMLMDAKADITIETTSGHDVVTSAMQFPDNKHTHAVPGMVFAVLSLDMDSDDTALCIAYEMGEGKVFKHVNEYKQVHNFIDEYHSVIKHALSEDVVVDRRVGRRGNGMYHEPLEQVLLYLGMSMNKNQTVNPTIDDKMNHTSDGKSVERALMPGHPTNANLWFELYQRTHCSSCSTRTARLMKCTCDTARYCNSNCQRKHWPTHKPSHNAALQEKK